MQATGDKQAVAGATDDAILSQLKDQLPFEYAERLVEGMVMEWRAGPTGPHNVLDDPDRSRCVVGGERDA
jgi:hypothetical protein